MDGTLKTETFFYTGFGKGDEIADFSKNYKTDGVNVRDYSIMFYEGERAYSADTDDAMSKTETRKETITGALKSETFFYTGFGKGEEIADFTKNYKTGGVNVRDYSIMFYEGERAAPPDIDYAMSRTATRKTAIDGALKSETFFYAEPVTRAFIYACTGA